MKTKRKPTHNSILNQTTQNTIIKQKITRDHLSKDIYNALLDKYPGEFVKQYQGRRNYIIDCIFGYHKYAYNIFKFIMDEVLKEPIPDDPEIIHLKNLERGKDLLGLKFSRLTPVECLGIITNDNCIYWKCVCDCGRESIVMSSNLLSGNTKSCGCYKLEILSTLATNKTHGMRYSREYRSW